MTRALVVAKAPVPGQVKTRLGAEVGMQVAAGLAAAALLDTLDACRAAFGPGLLALSGDLADAARSSELTRALAGWHVFPQRGDGLAERLAHAHADVTPGGPVLQVGMDTPQVTPDDLGAAAQALANADAVLGPADDGGWWALGLHESSDGAALLGVPMSTPTTYDATRRALGEAGLRVAVAAPLLDVDTRADAVAVAGAHPHLRFARAWSEVAR